VRSLALLGVPIAVAAPGACRAVEPTNKPVDACIHACQTRASRQCAPTECERGCEFILDRLVEKETDTVVACVAKLPRRCTDLVWADCAAQVGPHIDGGPPAPPPPQEDWE
jgi:hypothetical protein